LIEIEVFYRIVWMGTRIGTDFFVC